MAQDDCCASFFICAIYTVGKVLKTLIPIIQEKVAQKYGRGEKNEKITACPGVASCEHLSGTAGDTLEEMYEEARHNCPRECKKLATAGCDDFQLEANENLSLNERRVRKIEILRRRRQSGFCFSEAKMTVVEYEGLLIYDELSERFENLIADERHNDFMRATLLNRRGM